MKRILAPLFVVLTIAVAVAESFEAPGFPSGATLPEAWQKEGTVEVSTEQSITGAQALKVAPDGAVQHGPARTDGIYYADLQILPVAGPDAVLDLGGARLGFAEDGHILIYPGDETTAQPARNVTYELSNGAATGWVRVTVRIDAGKKKWDLYVDGHPAEANLALRNAEAALTMYGAAGGPAYLDDYAQTDENPLFEDSDNDGLPDAEEKANGLNPFADDRAGDLDADGISNVDEMFAGTSPLAPGVLSETVPRIFYVDNLHGAFANSGKRSYAVGSDGPMASLKMAMAEAPNGATIIILKGTGSYDEGSRGAPGKGLTIQTVDPVSIK